MLRIAETVWLVCFLAGLLLTGVFGTWSETMPFWYGAGLIAVAGAGSLVARQSRPSEKTGWICLVVLLLMAGYLGWRGLTSEVRWLARQDLVFASAAFVAWGLMATRFTGRRARLAVLGVLLLLVAGNAGVGLYQYYGDPRWTVFRLFGMKRAAEVSAGGFFESGNHLSGFMTLAGLPLLGTALLARKTGPGVRILCLLGFLCAGIGVGFSTSRGGALGFFAGFALLIGAAGVFSLSNRRGRTGRASNPAAGLLGLGILFMGLLAVATLTLRKFFGEGEVLTSLNGRGPLWDAALEQWQTSPLIGTGARSYEYMERGFRTMETQWMNRAGEVDAVFAHNDYLQCLGDYGLIGLALVLLATAIHFFSALRHVSLAATRPETEKDAQSSLATGLSLGCIAGICGLMVQALVEFNLHIGINAVMTAVLLGILATPGFRDPSAEPGKQPAAAGVSKKQAAGASVHGPRLAMTGIIAAVSVIFLATAWRLAPADLAWRNARKQSLTVSSLPEVITASAAFQKATTMDPLNPQAWYHRGMINLQLASSTHSKYARPFYEASLAQLEQSLTLYPQNPYAAAQAGKVASFLGKMDAADNHFRTALRWGLNIQSVNEFFGDYLMGKNDFTHAIPYLVRGLHLSISTDARENLGRKITYCRESLKKQGLPAPAETFLTPSESR